MQIHLVLVHFPAEAPPRAVAVLRKVELQGCFKEEISKGPHLHLTNVFPPEKRRHSNEGQREGPTFAKGTVLVHAPHIPPLLHVVSHNAQREVYNPKVPLGDLHGAPELKHDHLARNSLVEKVFIVTCAVLCQLSTT